MNKNKKLISFVCAVAMIFTMFSSFTIASAEGESFTLSEPVISADGKTITLDVGYANITSGVGSGHFEIKMPAAVTKVESNPEKTFSYENGLASGSFMYGATATDAASGKITTLTLTMGDNWIEADEILLAEGSYLEANDGEVYEIKVDGLEALKVVLPANPSAPTPKPVTTTTPAPVATEEPTPTENPDKPVIKDPVVSEKGFVFGTPVVSADGLSVDVKISYVGITSGVGSGHFEINMPATVTKVESNPEKTFGYEDGLASGSFMYGATATDAQDGDVTTLTLTLSEPFKYDNQLEFSTASYLEANDGNIYEVGKDDVLASNIVIPAFDGDDTPVVKDPTATIPLNKAITTGDVNDTLDEGKSQYFIIPTVKNGNDEAVYGDKYVVKYGDKELSKAQYSNLVNGHFDAENVTSLGVTSINDVVNKLVYVMYDKNVTLAAQLVKKDGGEIQNPDDKTVTQGPAPATPVPAKANVKVTADKTQISADGTARVTAEVTDATGATPGTEVKFEVTSGADYLDFDGSSTATVNVADGKASIRVYAKKVGKATVTATYAYKDKDGNDQTATGTVTINVKNTSTNGSSGSGSSSDKDSTGTGGPIAGSSTGNNGSNISGLVSFNDINDVQWAQEAIIMLANKGIISGRSEGIFAPNDNITRAEYCRILVGAIGKSNDSANVEFADVPTEAWFYHDVAVASSLGIVSGYGDGNFGPYDQITRQDMALMTYKAAQVMNKDLSAKRTLSFADAGQIADYAKTAVQTLADASIINGVSDTEFAPVANATRAQAAKILYDTFVK